MADIPEGEVYALTRTQEEREERARSSSLEVLIFFVTLSILDFSKFPSG